LLSKRVVAVETPRTASGPRPSESQFTSEPLSEALFKYSAMARSADRIRRLLADELGECCDSDVERRLDELHALADEAFGDDSLRNVFAVLGDETRYRLGRALSVADDELCVCELEPLVDVSESAVSHALSDLVDAGLVARRKDGNWRYYESTPLADELFGAAHHELTDRQMDDGEQAGDAPKRATDGGRATDGRERATEDPEQATEDPEQVTDDERRAGDPVRVAFVCVQNAGRSQMATAFAEREVERRGLADEVTVVTGGTQPADHVHEPVVEAMAEQGFDLGGREPREITFEEIRASDYVITMGCSAEDVCPAGWAGENRDWGLDDPDGADSDAVRAIRDEIERRVADLFDEFGSV
jgi:arsenate reductase